ncbi:uncharacterized protein GIQ15_01681 [Arthroderma uncinatum]|uniref:uncharacterized protein n=1 Tax=Arthroderma uncinatum TaxID=74035 RepID=UPI00144A6575|nr:uncharacterized protein GIQ15_01681 [Arthroderma uncinatum]KAF3492164.1 hypothetical protein GIQ15_01681 [Arthroderma uncinatum]
MKIYKPPEHLLCRLLSVHAALRSWLSPQALKSLSYTLPPAPASPSDSSNRPASLSPSGRRDCSSSGTLVPQSPSAYPSSFLHLNPGPLLPYSPTPLGPQLVDSTFFPAPDPFASFLSDTYLTQDQYPLSTTFSDTPGVTPTVSVGDSFDDPLQAFLSTEGFDFSNIAEQLLVPSSIDNSPTYTPTSEDSSLHSMKACEQYLLDIPLTSNADDSRSETDQPSTAGSVRSANSGHSSPTGLDLAAAPIPPVIRSPASSSNSTAESSSSRKRQRVDVEKRSEEEIANEKRQRNTMAARRFRKRKEDRISSLEQQLAEALRERDELKLQVARLEGQNMMLRK